MMPINCGIVPPQQKRRASSNIRKEFSTISRITLLNPGEHSSRDNAKGALNFYVTEIQLYFTIPDVLYTAVSASPDIVTTETRELLKSGSQGLGGQEAAT